MTDTNSAAKTPFGAWQRRGVEYSRGHFFEPTSDDEKRALFFQSIQSIGLEITSHCNRRCSYCPVSIVPRIHSQERMEDAVIERVVHDLASIDYAGNICLNLYNEPTSDRPFLLETVAKIRDRVPRSNITFSTNGDYLDREYLDAVVDAGLSEMIISIHTAPTKSFDGLDARERMEALASKLSSDITFIRSEEDDIAASLSYPRIQVALFARDFTVKGVSRAGAMKNVEVKRTREAPCDRPFRTLTIDYKANIFPCCMFYPDLPSSDAFVTGNLMDYPTIFDAYAAQSLANWRKELFTHGPKTGPCQSCTEGDWRASDAQKLKRLNMAAELGLETDQSLASSK